MLTLQQLKDMKRKTIFATGVGYYPGLYNDGEIRWVAVRGEIYDWALYYHNLDSDIEYIRNHGDKSFTEEVIRELVPCNDEAWKMYRY